MCGIILWLALRYKDCYPDKRIDDTNKHQSHDPYIPKTHRMRMYDLKVDSVPVSEKALKKYDCIVIATDHSCYDYEFIVKNAKLIVDTRNATKGIRNKGNIIKA